MAFIYGIYDPIWILMCFSFSFQIKLNKNIENDYYIAQSSSWTLNVKQEQGANGLNKLKLYKCGYPH